MDDERIEELSETHNNEIIEINATEEIETISDEELSQPELDNKKSKKEKKKKDKKKKESKIKKLKEKWNSLSKKKKIIIIVVSAIVLLLIISLLVYFLVFRNKETTTHEPEVVIEKGNYRYEDGVLVFLNDNEKEIGKYECKNVSEKNCYLANYSNEDEFDVTQKLDEKDKKIEVPSIIYNNKYVFIYDNKSKRDATLILYDLKNNKQKGEYKLVKPIDEKSVIVKDMSDQYGTLKLKSKKEKKIDFAFDYLGFIEETELLVAKTGSESKLIDFDGNDASKVVPGDIKNFNQKYISVSVDGEYSLYDYEGVQSLVDNISYIGFYEDFVYTISNRRMFFYDSELNPLNVEGIKLSAKEYNPIIIFDKNLKEKQKKYPFEITMSKNAISVDVDGEFSVINIESGKINKNYTYFSYYDGVIYVYSEETKENLIGSYACNNLNNVNSSTFDSCSMAHETTLIDRGVAATDGSGYLPIYNNRFAFIKDGSTIVLWDLTKKSKLATYSAVDAGYYQLNLSVINTDGTLVVAKNTSGNLGVIKIERNNVSGVVSFKDDSYGGATTEIRYLNNDFLVKRADGNYYLYKNTGDKKPLATSSSEIIEYNPKAIKVKGSGNTIAVNTLSGKVILGSALYVEFKDNYFVAIDSNKKINVYKYQENAKGLITEDVPTIDTTNYASSYRINGNTLEVINKGSYPFSLSEE